MAHIDKRNWNTYAVRGYTYDVANDQRSAGGVHLYQVRYHNQGGWQRRIKQSNALYDSFGPVHPIDEREGWALFETAKNY